MSKRTLSIITFNLILIAGVFFYQIFSKEQLMKNGEILYLKIAPRDPRSFMMGDYMSLSYQIENEIGADPFKAITRNNISDVYKRRSQNVAVKRNSDGLGIKARYYNGGKLARDEYVLHGQVSFYNFRILPNEYLFQEGKAKNFANAEYAQFRVDKKGNAIIECLLDKNFKRLK